MGGLPGTLHAILDSISLTLTALDIPPPPQPDPASAAPVATKGKPSKPGSAAKGKEVKDTPPETDLASLKGDPTPILTKDLASKLNPIVILPQRAKRLPDAPSTMQLLANKCSPTTLKINWPPSSSLLTGESREQRAANVGQWRERDDDGDHDQGDAASAVSGSKVHIRDVEFGCPEVYLAADYPLEGLVRACKEEPLIVQVHDRTSIPDPPEFPLPQDQEGGGAKGQKAKDDGYVCGIARMPLLELLKGRTFFKFRVPLLPFSTIRGAASLDWTTRPGNYCHANSELKVTRSTP